MKNYVLYWVMIMKIDYELFLKNNIMSQVSNMFLLLSMDGTNWL